jgi:putative sigma-54 modulation protein
MNVNASHDFDDHKEPIMQLNVTGHGLDMTDSLQNYVESKFEKLERHFDHVTNVHVILSVEKLRQKAEATLHLSGADIFADCTDEDMYAAIDALIDKLDRQVKKHKEKLTDHHRSEGRAQKTTP